MKLLLDARVSSRRVGDALRQSGYDVAAAAGDRALETLDDGELLNVAFAEHRVLVTFNHKDFAPLAIEWAASGRSHAGMIILAGIRHQEFGRIVERLEENLRFRPLGQHWESLCLVVSRRPTDA